MWKNKHKTKFWKHVELFPFQKDLLDRINKEKYMNNKVLIVTLLDRSGSMSSIQNDMIGGFNNFMNEQREDDLRQNITTYCSLYRFDDVYERVFSNTPITNGDVVRLSQDNFQPRGSTALVDSMCKCIDEVGRELAAMSPTQRPSKVVFITITDGEENSSKEFTYQVLSDKIKHQRDVYNWQFVYLGANQDAFSVGNTLSVNKCATANFSANAAGVKTAFRSVSMGMSSYKCASSPDAVYSLHDSSNE